MSTTSSVFNAGAEQARLEGLDSLADLAERWPDAAESLTSLLNVARGGDAEWQAKLRKVVVRHVS